MIKLVPAAILCFLCFFASAQTDTIVHGKIPVDGSKWYQLNNVSNGLQQLFDGDLYTRPSTGWGKILSNYDAYYAFPEGMDVQIDSIKLFDWEGSMAQYPATFYAIGDSTWQRKLLATFTGERYNGWDGPYPDRPDTYALDTAFKHVRYIILNSWYEYPTEVEFYGSYKVVPAATPAVKNMAPLKNYFGVNAFEWDFENPVNPMVVDSVRLRSVKSFTAVRHYMDWQKLESNEGKFTYNPVHSGGWNYDTLYATCKAQGITVLADLKTLPDWIISTYPDDQRDGENVPVEYGADFSNPASYIKQAKVAFQYAARYGSNKNVNRALLTVDSSQRWTNDEINTIRTGLDYVKYIECDNERDKWWKGRRAYQTGREYAANMSAFYDGHKGTLGADAGVKNADPGMLVVMGGLASATTDYVRGMIDWCKEFRGYKPDGTVNLCWDVVNYHLYANDARNEPNRWPTTGVAPEVSINDSVSAAFIQVMHEYAADMPVWMTEAGYDVNQGSPQKAIPVGNKTAVETQGDWILRTALQYAKSGVQRVFFYNLVDDNPWSGGPYATSGLVNDDRSRRPAADYLYQVNKLFGNYTYKQTKQTSPMVDKYTAPNNKTMYAVWLPTASGSSISYSLDVDGCDTAVVYQLQKGSEDMVAQKVQPVNGHITIQVSETPLFVETRYVANNLTIAAFAAQKANNLQWQVLTDSSLANYIIEKSADGKSFKAIGVTPANKKAVMFNAYTFDDEKPFNGKNFYRLKQVGKDASVAYSQIVAVDYMPPLNLSVYPNPVTSYVTVEGLQGAAATLYLVNGEGKAIATKTVSAKNSTFSLGNVAAGVYYINVQVGDRKQTLKFIKAK